MPRVTWPLRNGSPSIQVTLTMIAASHPLVVDLLADSGAGNMSCSFDLILEESDCLLCGGQTQSSILLGGACAGRFPVYFLRVQLPGLSFDRDIEVVGIPKAPKGFNGIAGFRFLNQFIYGNFGNPSEFGLETL